MNVDGKGSDLLLSQKASKKGDDEKNSLSSAPLAFEMTSSACPSLRSDIKQNLTRYASCLTVSVQFAVSAAHVDDCKGITCNLVIMRCSVMWIIRYQLTAVSRKGRSESVRYRKRVQKPLGPPSSQSSLVSVSQAGLRAQRSQEDR